VNTIYCLEEWRGKQRIAPPGVNFTPRGQNSPLGDNFTPSAGCCFRVFHRGKNFVGNVLRLPVGNKINLRGPVFKVKVESRLARWYIFRPKKYNLGKLGRALKWKSLVYLLAIWIILLPFRIVYGN
jgi:hypothetical protein